MSVESNNLFDVTIKTTPAVREKRMGEEIALNLQPVTSWWMRWSSLFVAELPHHGQALLYHPNFPNCVRTGSVFEGKRS
jgi:hypothetical protein